MTDKLKMLEAELGEARAHLIECNKEIDRFREIRDKQINKCFELIAKIAKEKRAIYGDDEYEKRKRKQAKEFERHLNEESERKENEERKPG